jgi:hypothetical protein
MVPQISKCSNSKLEEATEVLTGKDNFLCLAKWQISQVALLSNWKEGYNEDIWDSLLFETCPSLKCHKADKGIEVAWLATLWTESFHLTTQTNCPLGFQIMQNTFRVIKITRTL